MVAKHFVKHAFIFTTVFNSVQKKLRILQDYRVPSLKIIQSLYVFQRSDKLLIKRLERIHSLGVVDIRLWTIKCTEEHFEEYVKSIKIMSRGTTNGLSYRWSRLQQFDKNRTMPSSSEPVEKAIPTTATYSEKSEALAQLQDMLSCDDEEAATIYYNQIDYFDKLSSAKTNISFLIENQIDNRSILDNPFLLTEDVGMLPLTRLMNGIHTENVLSQHVFFSLTEAIKVKLDIIKEMQPKKVTDFVPLVIMDVDKLAKIRDLWKKETSSIEQKHRIYYFSEKLQVR